MREIKFRAWDGIRMTTNGIMFNNSTGCIETPNFARYKLMQFTGLHDKNGKEIYEGDIVEVCGTKSRGKYLDTVIYEHQGFKLKENATYLNDDRSLIGVVVVGNIHENPELIKEQK